MSWNQEIVSPKVRPSKVAVWRNVSRDEFFAGLYILGCVNGLFGRVLLAFNNKGWGGLLAVDISVIVLLACFAGVTKILQSDREPLKPGDLLVGVAFVSLVALPMFSLSWVAVTGLGFYILLCADDGGKRRQGALILLALTVTMLWGRLVFQFFNGPILEMDAILVASLLGTARAGNLIAFADGSGSMILLPECSSFTNMSLAFLCLVTVTQWVGHRWRPVDIWWSVAACVSIVAVNAARIGLTGISRTTYEAIHSSTGETIFGVIILLVTFGISVLSARRELFQRA
jgi:hypothetical protein